MAIRTVLAVCVSMILMACNPPEYLEREVKVTGFNFVPYTTKGFLFTPLPPSGNYESIGLISVSIQPEIKKATRETPTPKGYYEKYFAVKRYWVEEVSAESVIDQMYKTATSMGADALTQFSFQVEMTPVAEESITIPIYKASGFAIKRK